MHKLTQPHKTSLPHKVNVHKNLKVKIIISSSTQGYSADIFQRPLENIYSRFTSELQVRPDDIDMNQHVHSSRYLDYVLAARFEQMERCYKMSMQAFLDMGLSWVIKKSYIEFIRPLRIDDLFTVTTQICSFFDRGVNVEFEINRKKNGKICSKGYLDCYLINVKSGRSVTIPDKVKKFYEI